MMFCRSEILYCFDGKEKRFALEVEKKKGFIIFIIYREHVFTIVFFFPQLQQGSENVAGCFFRPNQNKKLLVACVLFVWAEVTFFRAKTCRTDVAQYCSTVFATTAQLCTALHSFAQFAGEMIKFRISRWSASNSWMFFSSLDEDWVSVKRPV